MTPDILLARIAATEAVARAATPGPWDRTVDHLVVAGYGSPVDGEALADCLINSEDAAHIALNDPARVLAVCAGAKTLVELADLATSMDVSLDQEFSVRPRDEVADPYLGDLILAAVAAMFAEPGEES